MRDRFGCETPYNVVDALDEFEMISTRTLALTRYKRNHELMEEVFKRAAFGNYLAR